MNPGTRYAKHRCVAERLKRSVPSSTPVKPRRFKDQTNRADSPAASFFSLNPYIVAALMLLASFGFCFEPLSGILPLLACGRWEA